MFYYRDPNNTLLCANIISDHIKSETIFNDIILFGPLVSCMWPIQSKLKYDSLLTIVLTSVPVCCHIVMNFVVVIIFLL